MQTVENSVVSNEIAETTNENVENSNSTNVENENQENSSEIETTPEPKLSKLATNFLAMLEELDLTEDQETQRDIVLEAIAEFTANNPDMDIDLSEMPFDSKSVVGIAFEKLKKDKKVLSCTETLVRWYNKSELAVTVKEKSTAKGNITRAKNALESALAMNGGITEPTHRQWITKWLVTNYESIKPVKATSAKKNEKTA